MKTSIYVLDFWDSQ